MTTITTIGILCMAVAFLNGIGIGVHPPTERNNDGANWYREQKGWYKIFLTAYLAAILMGYLELIVVLGIAARALIIYIN